MLYEKINLQPLKDHTLKVIKPFKYRDITIPEGFITDGASVPRPFWCIFPPNRTDYLPCAIIHDYLCDLGEYKKADQYFHDCLEELRVPFLTRKVMYYAVRFYHSLTLSYKG